MELYFIKPGVSLTCFSVYMATKVLKADVHCSIVLIVCLRTPGTMDTVAPPSTFWNFKTYCPSISCKLNNVEKSTYSFAQICFRTFSDTRWAKGTLAEIKGFLLVLPAEPSPAGSRVFPVSCWITEAVDASTRSCVLWGALICDCVGCVVVATIASNEGPGQKRTKTWSGWA